MESKTKKICVMSTTKGFSFEKWSSFVSIFVLTMVANRCGRDLEDFRTRNVLKKFVYVLAAHNRHTIYAKSLSLNFLFAPSND